MIALIDGDMLCYRIGFACNEQSERVAKSTMTNFVYDIIEDLGESVTDSEMFLTGKGNFRNDYAVTAPYKGNRKAEKPIHLPALRDHLLDKFNANMSEGEEADDAIAIRATELGDDSVIVSLDKDFNQLRGWKYNFVKKEWFFVTDEEGVLNFYKQFLEGDKIDNIIGVRGIGPKKAHKLLEGLTEREMFDKCAELLESEERAIENGRLLYLRRRADEIWNPPTDNSKEEEDSEASEGL